MSKPSLHTIAVVYATLIALWLATYGLATLALPAPWHLVAALGISSLKALLIATFFMQLYNRGRLKRVVACAGVFWLLILLGLAMCDYGTRGSMADDYQPPRSSSHSIHRQATR